MPKGFGYPAKARPTVQTERPAEQPDGGNTPKGAFGRKGGGSSVAGVPVDRSAMPSVNGRGAGYEEGAGSTARKYS